MFQRFLNKFRNPNPLNELEDEEYYDEDETPSPAPLLTEQEDEEHYNEDKNETPSPPPSDAKDEEVSEVTSTPPDSSTAFVSKKTTSPKKRKTSTNPGSKNGSQYGK